MSQTNRDGNKTQSLKKIASPTPSAPTRTDTPLDRFGENVFNEGAISTAVTKKILSAANAKKLLATMRGAAPLDPSIADEVARAMMAWATSRGATHFTHWFQPLTGGTAEKHDAFLELAPEGRAIAAFSGKNLFMGEPDASSLPSGGLRCTFEARGYTAWDPQSPAFLKRHANGSTLCIPSHFCSYTGQVLDKKTPLLRSIQALKKSVTRLMKCFGQGAEPVTITLGAEQEYFLIDREFYLRRPDLVQTGRTLFGSPPPKHQQLEDHYFGAIKPRVLAFMTEVEHELWELGVPAKTRHNETAPAQFEITPIFEEQNLSVDHNMLTMEVLKKTAERHGLVCLLHEKPFAGVNGSGKHNNWSVTFGKKNLLDPGANPHDNAIFLTVLAAVIRAVDLHHDLISSSVSGAGNEYRLGAHEAPPAIISIFLGEQLTEIITRLENDNAVPRPLTDTMRIGVDALPPLPCDTTDRNRTSPIAFTGNKFEVRAVGSSQSCAGINMVLNTIVAESLDFFSEQLEQLDKKGFNDGLQQILHEVVHAHKRIIFNGNNYAPQWLDEAAQRGLPNPTTTPTALKALLNVKNQALCERYGVFTPVELESRYDVFIEEYHRRVRIEGGIALEIARSMILPVVITEFANATKAIHQAKTSNITAGIIGLEKTTRRLGEKLDELVAATDALEDGLTGEHEGIQNALRALRCVVDALELIVDDQAWPLPKYREMLFVY